MSIYKPKNSPHFHYDFQLRGHRFFGTTGATDKKRAQEVERGKRREAEVETSRKSALLAAPMTLNIACDRYWLEVAQHQKRPDQVLWSLAWLLEALGKNTLMSKIGDDDVARIVAKRRGERVVNVAANKKRKRQGKLLSPSRVNRSVTEPLRKLMRRARDVWKQDIQPINWKAHLLKEPTERIAFLRRGEDEAALFAALPEKFHPLIYVKLRVGPRISGLLGLRWSDVDWSERRFWIIAKGGARKSVPMPSDVRDVLWSLQGRHPEYVFAYEDRCRMTYSGVASAWRRAVEAAGIGHLRLHDLRHTAATRFLSQSGNLRHVQQMLGHSDMRSTLRYAHALDEEIRLGLEASLSPEQSPGTIVKLLKSKETPTTPKTSALPGCAMPRLLSEPWLPCSGGRRQGRGRQALA